MVFDPGALPPPYFWSLVKPHNKDVGVYQTHPTVLSAHRLVWPGSFTRIRMTT
jgi:hypothetical protein